MAGSGFEGTKFFDGASDNFARGIQSGQQFAQAKMDADLKTQQVAFQREQLEQTKKQHQAEMGKDMIGRIENSLKIPAGPAKNQYIKIMQKTFAQYGFEDTAMLSAQLVDPEGQAKFKAALSQLYDMTPEEQEKMFAEAPKFLTDPEVNKHLEDFMSKAAELKKIKAEAEAKGEGGAPKNFEEGSKLATTLSQAQIFKDYSEVRVRARNVLRAMNSTNPFGDVATLFDFMKIVDPASVVRDSEGRMFIQTGSLPDYLKNIVQKWKSGEGLQPGQREQILSVLGNRFEEYQGQYRDFAEPRLAGAEEAGLSRTVGDPAANFYEADKKFLEDLKAAAKPKTKGGLEDQNNPSPSPAPKSAGTEKENGLKVAGAQKEDVLRKYAPNVVAQARVILQRFGGDAAAAKAYAEKKGKVFPEDLFKALGEK